MEGLITVVEAEKISKLAAEVNESRLEDCSDKRVVKLHCGKATIYHMGINNPTIRVDIKLDK